MAEIVLGLGSSHAPQLHLTPDQWWRRVEADKSNPELWYRGKTYTFPELVEERGGGASFRPELNDEKWQTRFDACQQAISHLAKTLDEVAPDVVVIFGDDQHECFKDDNMPALSIYWGEGVDDAPDAFGRRLVSGSAGGSHSNAPKERATHPTDPVLGRYLIEALIEDGFDVAHSRTLPKENHEGAIGHAFHYVYRRLMNNEVIPNVPVFMNTYYPPNQPTVKRCFQLGRAIRKAIEAWDSPKRVALVASGGLSHFVIEEDLDNQILDGLKHNDEAKLTELPNIRFNSGTSEIRNWITLAGAMADDGLTMKLVDYVPCYRSEAGTGCAMGFAEWR